MSISERGFVFSAKGRRRRRPWSDEEKRQILTEAAAPGASVSTVARRHDRNANLLFTWRRQLAEADGCPQTSPAFMPAVMIDAGEPAAPSTPAASGIMEIVLVSGHRVIVGMDVDAAALARVIKIVGHP